MTRDQLTACTRAAVYLAIGAAPIVALGPAVGWQVAALAYGVAVVIALVVTRAWRWA